MADLNFDGMALADGVVETIVAMSMQNVEGVASVGGGTAPGFLGSLGAKSATPGIELAVSEDNKLEVAVHVEAFYGHSLPEVAQRVRRTIVDAVLTQVGVDVSAVDVYIDSIQFA